LRGATVGGLRLPKVLKTGFNSVSGVLCVNRYLRTRVDITVGEAQSNTKVDSTPKMWAGKLRRGSGKRNRLKDEKAVRTSVDYYRITTKCKGHNCNFIWAMSRAYK
jgi:hypothetical protein